MKLPAIVGGTAALLILAAAAGRSQTGMVRGTVVDEQGAPLPDVRVELQYSGERPHKFVRMTDKKGGYVRIGMPPGPYQLTFSKDGYQAHAVDVTLSLGGLSEIPPVRLKKTAPLRTSATDPAVVEAAPPEIDKLKDGFARALEATKAGRLDEAEAGYKAILATAPDLPEAHFNLGYVYRLKKDWPAAEAEYKRVIALQPDKADAYSALAGVHEDSGQREKAVELLAGAAPRFEQDARFQFDLAVTELNAGRSEAAEAVFRKTLALDPGNVEVRFYLGTIAVGKGKVDEALRELEVYVAGTGQKPRNLAIAQALLKALKAKKP
jgi:tetratricopeptide (TPR) repeat protein